MKSLIEVVFVEQNFFFTLLLFEKEIVIILFTYWEIININFYWLMNYISELNISIANGKNEHFLNKTSD